MDIVKIILLITLHVLGYVAASDSLSKNDSFQFTGQALIDMGIKLNKTSLKFIGKIMSRVESQINEVRSASYKTADVIAEICRLHPCSEWSEWSKCDATQHGEFGGQSRSRNCGLNTTLCKHYTKPTVVQDTRVCEFLCPKDYTSSGHGFCLKLYGNEKIARDDAEKVCQGDGGHLVNVDSAIKVKYVNETIQGAYSGDLLWIDGRRSKNSDPFTYGYKSTDPSFTFWGDNDPDNGANDLCIMYHKASSTNNIWRWFDYSCDSKYAFICQYQ